MTNRYFLQTLLCRIFATITGSNPTFLSIV